MIHDPDLTNTVSTSYSEKDIAASSSQPIKSLFQEVNSVLNEVGKQPAKVERVIPKRDG